MVERMTDEEEARWQAGVKMMREEQAGDMWAKAVEHFDRAVNAIEALSRLGLILEIRPKSYTIYPFRMKGRSLLAALADERKVIVQEQRKPTTD